MSRVAVTDGSFDVEVTAMARAGELLSLNRIQADVMVAAACSRGSRGPHADV